MTAHVDDRNQDDKLAPIRKIYEKWLPQLKKAYCPGNFITVDEMIVPFQGKVPFKQRIPLKVYKYGIRIWVAADSQTRYAYNLQIYEGKDRKRASKVELGERVVLDLTEGIRIYLIVDITCIFFNSFQFYFHGLY